MARGSESFTFALGALRGELRAGRHPPMTRITAGETAERLLVSATPVREALSRLAGEGLLLDRRGQGFFVPRLEASDVEDLYRMQRDLLLIACKAAVGARRPGERERLPPSDQAGGEDDDDVAVPRSEQIFRRLALKSSAALARELDRLQDQIAPVRIHEPAVLGGLATELGDLFRTVQDEPAARVGDALGGYFDRRIAAAPRLARTAANIDSI